MSWVQKKWVESTTLLYKMYPAMVAEWAKVLPQIQVEAHQRSQVWIPLKDIIWWITWQKSGPALIYLFFYYFFYVYFFLPITLFKEGSHKLCVNSKNTTALIYLYSESCVQWTKIIIKDCELLMLLRALSFLHWVQLIWPLTGINDTMEITKIYYMIAY